MKLDELKAQMAKVRDAAGAELEMAPEDVDGDFDPAAHDARMAAMFNDDYYEGDEEDLGEGEWEAGDGKRPAWAAVDDVVPADEQGGDEQEADDDAAAGAAGAGAGAGDSGADGDGGIDVDAVRGPSAAAACACAWRSLGYRRVCDAVPRSTVRVWSQVLAKYDFEDVVGGIKTRFRYKKVPSADFGLGTEDIIKADDKMLNRCDAARLTVAVAASSSDPLAHPLLCVPFATGTCPCEGWRRTGTRSGWCGASRRSAACTRSARRSRP